MAQIGLERNCFSTLTTSSFRHIMGYHNSKGSSVPMPPLNRPPSGPPPNRPPSDPPSNRPASGPTPMGPPPSQTPQKPAQARAGTRMVSPGSIRHCIGRFTYVWLSNGQEFWFFPIQVWGNSVAGFRWDRRFGWSYTGISLNRIDMFTCT